MRQRDSETARQRDDSKRLPPSRRPAVPPSRRLPASPALWLSFALALLFFIVLTALAFARHAAFATGLHDLEIYSQVTWGLANGAPFATTLLRTNTLHLAEHLALVLLPLAPLYGLLPEPRLLLVVQQLALAGAALGVGLWARCRLNPRVGLVASLLCLLTPGLAGVALDDFHAVALTTLPIAIGLALALRGHPRTAALCFLTAALMEEEAWLALAGLGLLLLARGPRRLGAGLLAGGLAALALAAFVVMPGFHQPGSLDAAAGTRSTGHFTAVRARPAVVLERATGPRGQDAVTQLLLPFGGLGLLAPEALLVGAPTSGALFLQDRDDTFARHWTAPILPAAWLAALVGLARLPRRWRPAGLGLAVVGSGAAYVLASPLPGGGAFRPDDLVRGPREQALEWAVAAVPRDAPTVASATVAAHLATRRELYVYPVDDQYAAALGYEARLPAVEAYVLDLNDAATQRVSPLSKMSPLMASPPYIAQSTGAKVLALTRSAPPPTHSLDALFGRGMAFRGYDLHRETALIRLTFHWERIAGISADFRRIVELVDGQGAVLATDGDLELTRTLQTQKWQVGQQVRDEVELRLPPGPTAPLRVRVQWQNREQRRPILLQDGSSFYEIPL